MPLPALFRPRSMTRADQPLDPFERLMQRFFQDFPAEAAEEGYPVDINEVDDHLVVDAELPGFKSDEIDVKIEDDMLSIQAERSSETTEGRQHLHERRFSRVQRTFRLPSAVDPDSVEAKLEGGVLHMDMKKTESSRARKIEVK